MIERVLEPEVMDSHDESIAYDDMDHQAVNQQFVDDLLASGASSGEVLDLGTGTARIPILFCEQCADIRVIGIDLSIPMLEIAMMKIDIASLRDRVILDRADVKAMPFEDNRFDVVMSNSIVHHIPEPALAISEAVRVTKPGGRIFFRDLVRPESEDALAELTQQHVAEESEPGRKMFVDSLRAALTISEVREMVGKVGMDPQAVNATSDRHWTWSGTKPS